MSFCHHGTQEIDAVPNYTFFNRKGQWLLAAMAACRRGKGTKASERRQYPSLQLHEHEIDS